MSQPGLQSDPSQPGLHRCNTELNKTVRGFPNWTPPTSKEISAWTKAFQLTDELLAAYVCTVPARLKYHGRLFLSMGHVCFSGVAVTHVLHFVVALNDVEEIGHGGSRDAATIKLRRAITLKGVTEQVMSIDIFGCEDGCAALSRLLARHCGSEDDDDDEVEGAPPGSPTRSRIPRLTRPASAPALPPSRRSVAEATAAAAVLDDSTPFQPVLTATVPRLQITPLAHDLLANEWGDGSLIVDFYKQQGGTEICVSPCVDLGTPAGGSSARVSVVQVREMNLSILVPPGPMCPERTRMTVTFRLSAVPAPEQDAEEFIAVTVEASCVSYDVPFGHNFLVQERIEFVPALGVRGAQVTKSFRCVFLRGVGLLASAIRKFTYVAQARSGDVLVSVLQKRVAPLPLSLPATGDEEPLDALSVTCTLNIWELQRRATLFHTDWGAPFLPHDGQKRWRWVDTSYQRHPWTRFTDRETAAAATEPPIGPHEGWEPQGEWTICTGSSDGTGDDEGWQYAIDLYLDEWWWNPSNSAHHVRRRLWARNFVRLESALPVGSYRSDDLTPLHG